MLDKKEIREYWENRTKAQGEKTVGFSNSPMDLQEDQYKQRFNFIIPKIPYRINTLDYGCGIGRYSQFFDDYLGVDITKELLSYATKNNPDKDYLYLKGVALPETLDFDFELFFTATVLQHNSDEVVKEVFESLYKLRSKNFTIALYENSESRPNSHHVAFRSSKDYIKLISESFKVLHTESYSHIIHGEEHSLTIIKV